MHPWDELTLGPKMLRGNPQPPSHPTATHDRDLGLRGTNEPVRDSRVYSDKDPSTAAGSDGHVSVDQKRQPPEHHLLAHTRFATDQLPNAIGKILVIGHQQES